MVSHVEMPFPKHEKRWNFDHSRLATSLLCKLGQANLFCINLSFKFGYDPGMCSSHDAKCYERIKLNPDGGFLGSASLQHLPWLFENEANQKIRESTNQVLNGFDRRYSVTEKEGDQH